MIIIYILLALFAIYLFLIAPRFNKPDCSFLDGYFYAHRGLFNNIDIPENSLKAFQKAVDNGYGMELDVQLTKDNVLVVFHDASLERMCGVKGNVWEYTYEELQEFRLLNTDIKIPTFKEVLEVIDGQVPFILEFKEDVVQTTVCELSNEMLKDYKGPYCVESFHPIAVKWYKDNRPDIVRGQLAEAYWNKEDKKYHKFKFYLVSSLVTNVLTRPDFIAYDCVEENNIPRKLTRLLGAKQVTWTIKSKEQYERLKDQYDYFIFDSCEL